MSTDQLKSSQGFQYVAVIAACFATGWLLGNINFSTVKRHVTQAYVNQYEVMSGSNTQFITYYVVSDNETALSQLAGSVAAINAVENAGYPGLFNVVVAYHARRETVQMLRRQPEVSAVFSVPFMCH